ncbi:MAG: helix-turn-helix transcriptional regulator [Actinocatenispora sp.]
MALSHFRRQAKMTLDDAAAQISSTKSTISRMENGKALSRPAVIRALFMTYGVTGDELDALTALAKEANQPGWWRSYAGILPTPHVDHIALESEATDISAFDPAVVPGLLQTSDYVRRIMRDGVNALTDEEIERRVEARLERQKRLTTEDPPQLCAILDEAVLRRPIGGPEVMRGQLTHLLRIAELPNVTLQLVPFSETAHPGLQGSVTILEFSDAEDPRIAVLETVAGDMVLHKADDVRQCARVFDRLRSVALDPDRSRATMGAILEAEY